MCCQSDVQKHGICCCIAYPSIHLSTCHHPSSVHLIHATRSTSFLHLHSTLHVTMDITIFTKREGLKVLCNQRKVLFKIINSMGSQQHHRTHPQQYIGCLIVDNLAETTGRLLDSGLSIYQFSNDRFYLCKGVEWNIRNVFSLAVEL